MHPEDLTSAGDTCKTQCVQGRPISLEMVNISHPGHNGSFKISLPNTDSHYAARELNVSYLTFQCTIFKNIFAS